MDENLEQQEQPTGAAEAPAQPPAKPSAPSERSKPATTTDPFPATTNKPQAKERIYTVDPDTGRRVYLDGLPDEQSDQQPQQLGPPPAPAFELLVPETLSSSEK